MALIAYPTKFEVYDDAENLMATFNAFDDASFRLTMDTIVDSDDLIALSSILKQIETGYKEGITPPLKTER